MAAPNTYLLEAFTGGTRAVTHSIGNDVIIVAGASGNLCSNSTDNVQSAVISQVFYGSQGGAWLVQRVANASTNVTVGVFSGTDHVSFEDEGIDLGLFPAGNVNVYLVGSSNGFIILDFKKTSSFS